MDLKLTRLAIVPPRLLKKIQQFYKWGFETVKTDEQIKAYTVTISPSGVKNAQLTQNCIGEIKKYFDPQLKLIRLSFDKLKAIISRICKEKSAYITQWQKQSVCEHVFKQLKLIYVTTTETVPFVFTV